MSTYTNVIKTHVLDPLWVLLRSDFPQTKITMNLDYRWEGEKWFNIIITDNTHSEHRTWGHIREYGIELRYYQTWDANMDRGYFDKAMTVVEEVKRLLEDNVNYSPSSVYKWHNLEIIDINYDPDREEEEMKEDLSVTEFIITLNVEEVHA